jgi:hypothetical protein
MPLLSLRRLARRLVTTHFEVPLYASGFLLLLLLPVITGPGCGHTVDQSIGPTGIEAPVPEAQVPADYPVQLHVQKVVIYDREEVKAANGEDRVDMSVLIEGHLDARVGFTVIGMIDTILPINPRVGQWSMMPHRDVYSAAPTYMGRGNVSYFRLNKRIRTTLNYVGVRYSATIILKLDKPRSPGHDETIELCFEGVALDAGTALADIGQFVSDLPADIEGEDL